MLLYLYCYSRWLCKQKYQNQNLSYPTNKYVSKVNLIDSATNTSNRVFSKTQIEFSRVQLMKTPWISQTVCSISHSHDSHDCHDSVDTLPWKWQKTRGSLKFSGGIEMEHWYEMGYKVWVKTSESISTNINSSTVVIVLYFFNVSFFLSFFHAFFKKLYKLNLPGKRDRSNKGRMRYYRKPQI